MAEELPLFPLNTVLFPGMALPLHIFEPRYREMIGLCSQEKRPFGVVLIREGAEVGDPATPFDVGTMARIVDVNRLEDGRMNVMTVGTKRFRILSYFNDRKPYMIGDVEPLADDPTTGPSAALSQDVAAQAQRYVAMIQAAAEQRLTPLRLPSDAEEASYAVAAMLRVRNRERQRLLEMQSTAERLALEKQLLERESAALTEFLQRRTGGVGPFSRN